MTFELKTIENTRYPQLDRIDELIYKWVDDAYDMKDKVHLANELRMSKIPNEYKRNEDLFGYRCMKIDESKSLSADRYEGLSLISFSEEIFGISDFLPKDLDDKRYFVFKKYIVSKDICVDVKKWFRLFKHRYKRFFNKEPFVSEIGHISKMVNKECEILCFNNSKLSTIEETDILDIHRVSKFIKNSKRRASLLNI